MADGFNIEVDGIKATVKALGKVDKDLRKEAGAIVRKYATKVKKEAQAKYTTSPGVRRNGYPFGKGAVIHRATATQASVGINRGGAGKNAAVFAAEFGAYTQMVPIYRGTGRRGGRRFVSQNAMKRRTFPIWRGNQTTIRGKAGPGWVIMPILRKRVPEIEEEFETEMVTLFAQTMRKNGVPRG